MTDTDQRKRGPFVGCLAIAALLLPLAYFLSIGPVIWLSKKGYLSDSVRVVYTPLVLLADICKPIHDALWWYVGLWGGP